MITSETENFFNDLKISEIPEKFDKENSFENSNENESEISDNNLFESENDKEKDKEKIFEEEITFVNKKEENKPEHQKEIEIEKENLNLNPINGDIEIKNIKRPFTIFLHDIKMKKDFDCINEKLNEFYYKVNIKVQIFCGGQEYTKHKTIEWKSKFVPKNKHIGKLIEFDLGYESLPMFASIVFKIKIVLFNNKRQPVHMDNLYWTNFKLFDHNRRLKTGKISYKKFKVYLFY